MPDSRTQHTDFNRAFGDAKKHASGVAMRFGSRQDIYGQASTAPHRLRTPGRPRVRPQDRSKKALRSTIETQPYTAVVIALDWAAVRRMQGIVGRSLTLSATIWRRRDVVARHDRPASETSSKSGRRGLAPRRSGRSECRV